MRKGSCISNSFCLFLKPNRLTGTARSNLLVGFMIVNLSKVNYKTSRIQMLLPLITHVGETFLNTLNLTSATYTKYESVRTFIRMKFLNDRRVRDVRNNNFHTAMRTLIGKILIHDTPLKEL